MEQKLAHTHESDSLDLAQVSQTFNPYLFERHPVWMALPLVTLAMILIHLRRGKKR